GGFVLGAIGLIVVAVPAFAGGQLFTQRMQTVAFFEGSVGGLSAGAPVTFRGVRIGEVTSVVVRYDTHDQTVLIPVHLEIEQSRINTVGTRKHNPEQNLGLLIERGLRAQLVTQSMVTGQQTVQLDFFPNTPIRLTGIEHGVPEIPTVPSSMDELTANVSAVL